MVNVISEPLRGIWFAAETIVRASSSSEARRGWLAEERGQRRLFKRPETDEEAEQQGMHVSKLTARLLQPRRGRE
jgi:hypothetical protein